MVFVGTRRRWQRLSVLGLVLYGAFLLATPFEHHDLSCELKTPQHCTACALTFVGTPPDTSAASGACQTIDAGDAVLPGPLFTSVLLDLRSRGRSPPTV